MELAILEQPAIRGRLAAVLKPLDAGTDLRRTLEVLLACNLDRERAARELWIHRRTLHYRLDRIRDLSGVDPSSARGIQLFRAALTSARLTSDRVPRPGGEGRRAQEASLPPPLTPAPSPAGPSRTRPPSRPPARGRPTAAGPSRRTRR
ncbi:PucR family transcriptional regulator [Actinomadura monticuli]|uniref:Helix-turn-helix domain-containing protein n=1 Tax=Actinomadura monticuli TaxID=3097367 RepID=A0ABV4QIL4_9ACTN